MRLLGAKISRIQSEFLSPLLKRQFNILNRMAILPTNKYLGLDDLNIEFCGHWNNYQQQNNKINFPKVKDTITTLANIDNKVIDKIDWYAMLKLIFKTEGIPDYIFNK